MLKKGSFRMFHRNQARWCRAKKIRRETLLVLLYLELGPWGAGQYTGLYYVSVSDIADFTGLEEQEVSRAIKSLERMGVIVYDRKKQIVFVRGMLERQSPSFASSKNNLLGIANHVERMPEGSQAVQEFIKSQKNVPELFELLEGYLEGESEGDFEQTLDLDTRDLRPGDLDTGDKETIIAPKDRDDDALSPNLSSNSKSKGNGKGQGAVKGKISIPTTAISAILTADPADRQKLNDLCISFLGGQIERGELIDRVRSTESLPYNHGFTMVDVLTKAREKMEATQ